MGRPLLISDCDEVILHFASHFGEWVAEAAGLELALDAPGFAGALRSRDGRVVPKERVWPLLDLFFEREMHRQNVVPGAVEALAEIGRHAEIVILTNIGDDYQANRVAQLEAFDIRHRVLCNRGGKGRPVLELVEEMKPLWLRIGGYWYPRGGMPIDVFWQSGPPPAGLWVPDQGVPSYRGRG